VLGKKKLLVRTYILFLLGVRIVEWKGVIYLLMMNAVIVEVKTRYDIMIRKLLTCCFSITANYPIAAINFRIT